MSTETSFDEAWSQIRSCKGEAFKTERGLEFKYSLIGNWIVVTGTDFRITKRNFQKAYGMLPVDNPDGFSEDIMAPYFVHAILTDTRIIQSMRVGEN